MNQSDMKVCSNHLAKLVFFLNQPFTEFYGIVVQGNCLYPDFAKFSTDTLCISGEKFRPWGLLRGGFSKR